jgi:hypothetical protein
MDPEKVKNILSPLRDFVVMVKIEIASSSAGGGFLATTEKSNRISHCERPRVSRGSVAISKSNYDTVSDGRGWGEGDKSRDSNARFPAPRYPLPLGKGQFLLFTILQILQIRFCFELQALNCQSRSINVKGIFSDSKGEESICLIPGASVIFSRPGARPASSAFPPRWTGRSLARRSACQDRYPFPHPAC